MTGTASSTIHSGLFSEVMNACTTLRRLIARCCFWPFDVLIVSRRVLDSSSRSRSRSSSRIASAPIRGSRRRSRTAGRSGPSARGTSCSSAATCLTSSSRSSYVSSKPADPRRRPRGWSRRLLHVATSLTLVAHCWTASRSFLARALDQAQVVGQLAHLLGLASDSARSSTSRSRPMPVAAHALRGSSRRRTPRARRPRPRARRPRATGRTLDQVLRDRTLFADACSSR